MDAWDEYANVNLDDFDIQLRRQGWLRFEYANAGSDPQVLRQKWIHPPTSPRNYGEFEFYERFGKNSFRKVLRAIYSSPGATREGLQRICSNADVLDDYLSYLMDQEIAYENSGTWQKTPRWEHVDSIGRTLEWYVAQWFRSMLAATARHGVHVPNLAGGGDLDVVAIMDGMCISVECKSGREISQAQLRHFLLRTEEFHPTLAILLIDTDSDKPIEQVIETLNRLRSWGDPMSSQNQANTLYWGMQRVYAVNVKKQTIGEAIASALRLYHSDIKSRSFFS